jgi:hypothetical protein
MRMTMVIGSVRLSIKAIKTLSNMNRHPTSGRGKCPKRCRVICGCD